MSLKKRAPQRPAHAKDGRHPQKVLDHPAAEQGEHHGRCAVPGNSGCDAENGSLDCRLQGDDEVAGVVDDQALIELNDRRRTRFLDDEGSR